MGLSLMSYEGWIMPLRADLYTSMAAALFIATLQHSLNSFENRSQEVTAHDFE